MSEPLKIPTSVDKDHTQVLDMLNSTEMQKRLEEARARRAKVLAERVAETQDEPRKPAVVQVATAARMVEVGRTPLLLVEPLRKPPVLRVLPRLAEAAHAPEPVAMRTVPTAPMRRGLKPSGLVMGLALGLAAGAGLMQFIGPETPRLPKTTGTDQASVSPSIPAGSIDQASAAAGLQDGEASAAGQSVAPRARPGNRPDVGLVVLPKIVNSESAAPDGIAPQAANRPVAVAATVDGTPATPPVASRPMVTLHLSPEVSDDVLSNVQSALLEAGTEVAATRVAGFGVARSEVRFFHERDAEDARRIAERLGTTARDFSTYRPVPSAGTLEVWLARRS